jgi:hypothetical protein
MSYDYTTTVTLAGELGKSIGKLITYCMMEEKHNKNCTESLKLVEKYNHEILIAKKLQHESEARAAELRRQLAELDR